MNIISSPVTVLVGDTVDVASEQAVIARLRRDLADAGVPALIIANVTPPGRKQRQVDLLVVTPFRVAQVEVKGLDPRSPIVGRLNGPWVQLRPDGTEHALSVNVYAQALNATYAVGDSMRSLERAGKVPAIGAEFSRRIDTIVCIWERIPEGSQFEKREHVSVVDYDGLLRRLQQPGPKFDWTDEHWQQYVHLLGVYNPDPGSAEEQARQAALDDVNDYRAHAALAFRAQAALLARVRIQVSDGQDPTDLSGLSESVLATPAVVLTGRSGLGKSLHARHVALRHSDAGRLVVWVRCGEYLGGRLSDLLARSTAPYSATNATTLLRNARTAGVGVTVILDGVNECPAALRSKMFDELQALLLRYPCSLLATATTADLVPSWLVGRGFLLTDPTAEEKTSILAVHDAELGPDDVVAFTTPLELALAAQCAADLDHDATPFDLFDAYVRRVCPSERERSVVRALAVRLHDGYRTVTRLGELREVASRVAPGEAAGTLVDAVAASALLSVERNRVSFQHELLRDFLVVEDMLLQLQTGEALAHKLASAPAVHLTALALGGLRDTSRLLSTLDELAEPRMYERAVQGAFGQRHVARVAASIVATLEVARHRTAIAAYTPGDLATARWTGSVPWTRGERARLLAAGALVGHGFFFEPVAALLDATDARCAEAVAAGGSGGDAAQTSTVVATTYTQFAKRDDRGLGASMVVVASDLSGMMGSARCERLDWLLDGAGEHSCGRYLLATQLFDPRNEVHRSVLPQLLRDAWSAGGYHLQLEALTAVVHAAHSLDDIVTAECLAVIDTFGDGGNWALSSTIVEALAALGALVPSLTCDDLVQQYRAALSGDDGVTRPEIASGLLSMRFEDESVVGPYGEAFALLASEEQARLLILAAWNTAPSLFRAANLFELVDLLPGLPEALRAEALEVVGVLALRPGEESAFVGEEVDVWITAVIVHTLLTSSDKEWRTRLDDSGDVWSSLRRVVEASLREDAAATADLEAFCEVHKDCAADALYWLMRSRSGIAMQGRPYEVYGMILKSAGQTMRTAFEWALTHPDEVRSVLSPAVMFARERQAYIVRTLGAIGNEGTVALLEDYVLDPELGTDAVSAIRSIRARDAHR